MFQVGDKVVHPMHGAGVIDSIVREKISGKAMEFYVFKMPISGLTLKIPTENSAAIGVRAIKSVDEIEAVIARIPKLGIDMTSNWNHRYRENMDRLKSGDLDEVSAVIKALMHRDSTRGLSNGERKMLHIAKQILVSEIVLAEDVEYPAAESRVNAAMLSRRASKSMGLLKKLFRRTPKRTRPYCAAIIAAAGSSVRYGGENKLMQELGGMPVLARTLLAVDRAGSIDEIVIAAREDELLPYAQLCKTFGIQKPVKVVPGGATRTESVLRAALEASEGATLLAVQDGARPLVTSALIDDAVAAAQRYHAAAPAVPVTDTIKVAHDGIVESTPERSTLFAVQTPQVFDAELLKAALQDALRADAALTDDCSAVERFGKEVHLTAGDRENIKITTPLDLTIAEAILQRREES